MVLPFLFWIMINAKKVDLNSRRVPQINRKFPQSIFVRIRAKHCATQ